MISILNKLAVQRGSDYIASNGFIFKNPKMKDMADIGDDNYFWFMSVWTKEPHECIHELFANNIEYTDIIFEELFIMKVRKNIEHFSKILKVFTNIVSFDIKYIESEELECLNCIVEYDKNLYPAIITSDILNEIKEYLRFIHLNKEVKKRRFSSKATMKKILEYEIEEFEHDMKNKKNIGVNFHDVVSCVVNENNRTWEYVYDCTVYQVIEEFTRGAKRENSKRLYTGIYSGTINYKDMKNKEELNWIS